VSGANGEMQWLRETQRRIGTRSSRWLARERARDDRRPEAMRSEPDHVGDPAELKDSVPLCANRRKGIVNHAPKSSVIAKFDKFTGSGKLNESYTLAMREWMLVTHNRHERLVFDQRQPFQISAGVTLGYECDVEAARSHFAD
jgi:hypothetical protein